MKRTARPSQIADILHKGFIWTCIGLTAYGFSLGGFRVYRYFSFTRPQRQAVEAEKLLGGEGTRKDPEELRS